MVYEEQHLTKVKVKQSLRFCLDLFKDTFKKGGAYSEEMEKIQHGLHTRAWIIHMIMMFSRIAYPLLGIAFW